MAQDLRIQERGTRLNPHVRPGSPFERILSWLAESIYSHRRWFFYPHILFVFLSLYFTITGLQFRTQRNDLVGADKDYHRIFLAFRKEFPAENDLVVMAESHDLEKNRQFMERLAAKLEAETNLFANVFYKGDLNMLGSKALLFMSESQLKELHETLASFLPMLKRFTATTNLVALFDLVNTEIRTAKQEDTPENRNLVKALPALDRVLERARDALHRPGKAPSPGLYSLFEGGKDAIQKVYITFSQGRIFLLSAQAPRGSLETRAIHRLRQLILDTQQEVPGLNVGLTGEPVLEVDEMSQSQKDTTLATIVSLIAVALIFIFGYHETGRPLKATLCLVVGLIYTMGYTTLSVGHLNILTITFVPMLVGLAIDFGVHLISRYEEELWHGRTEKEALEKAVVNTGTGIFTGAFTTAGAFFAMGFTDFLGIKEMGIICGGGLLICLLPMVTLLPVMLLKGRQNVLDHEQGPQLDQLSVLEQRRFARIENVWLQHPVRVILFIGIVSSVAMGLAPRARFDYNLLNMQSEDLPAVLFQEKLIGNSPKSVLFAAVVAPNAEAATNLAVAITNLPSVSSLDTLSFILAEDQTAKLTRLRQVKELFARVEFLPPDQAPVQVEEFIRTLWSLHGYVSLALREVSQQEPESELDSALRQLLDTIGLLLRDLRVIDRNISATRLAQYQQALFRDIQETFQVLREQDATTKLLPEDLPDPLRKRFIGATGKQLLQVYPKKNVWNRAEQEEFVRELRQVQRTVTGTPVQLLEYTTLLKESYQKAGLYSLLAIALLTFMHFKSVVSVILAMLPVGIGAVWTFGLMGAFDVPFNPANIIILPLIVGIGITNGVHILNRFEEEQHPSILARSTGKAVLVSGLTTVAGFASLMLGEHRGIRSLGFVMSVGVTACMVVALTFLPAILNLKSGIPKRQAPARKKNPV